MPCLTLDYKDTPRHQDLMENLSDMEVILDFLEEHYGHTSEDGSQKFDDIFMTRELPVDETCCAEQSYCSHWEFNPLLDDDTTPAFTPNTGTLSLFGSVPSLMPARQPAKPHTKTAGGGGGGGGKLRLFRFLFEVLEDPGMAHCVAWVPAASAGVFRFSSRNKDQVAALWGQRKGNKRPMTYQKMSRALRNYARSGEIFKVKKKLTYQFSRDTLWALQSCCHHRHL